MMRTASRKLVPVVLGFRGFRRNARQDRLVAVPSGIRVVHLTSAHRVDDPRIFVKECVSLARAGYRVAIIAPGDNPGRRLVQGVEMITIRRRSGRLGRMLASTLGVVIAGLCEGGTLYHFHDPELIPAGLLLRMLGKRVVYDAHEDLPRDILFKNWIPPRLRRSVSRLAAATEWVAGRTLSGIIAATPMIALRFPTARTALVQNYARLSEFEGNTEVVARRDRRVVAYIGAVTVQRCAVEMIEAIARVERFPDAQLIVAGDIETPTLAHWLAALDGWPRVEYRGFQSRSAVRTILAEARAGLAIFHPTQSYIESQPVKIFEYMAAGLPVIAADFPRFREIVEGNGCGICVPPRDPAAIAAAIEWVFEHPGEAEAMGRRGRDLVLAGLNWEGQEKALLQLYHRILGAAVRPMT